MVRETRGSKKPKKPVEDNDVVTTLTVILNQLAPNDVHLESEFELILDNFDKSSIEQLKKYSNVTTFNIQSNNIDWDDLLKTLAIWKSKITNLTVHVTENRNFDLEDSLEKWHMFLKEAPKICTAIKYLYVEDTNICNFVNDHHAAYLNSIDQYFNIPKKLKFESLYFGLPLADFQSVSTQMKTGQFKKLTKLAIFNLSNVQLPDASFQLPQEVANNLTHYCTIQESFFESSTFKNLTFNSLTHLQIKTMLPLEKLFRLLGSNFNFPQLEYLSIDNRANLNNCISFLGNQSLKRKVPEDEREFIELVPVLRQLNTLEIHHPPHAPLSMSWSESLPNLGEVHLKTSLNEPMFGCQYCLESANYAECHKEFYQSFQKLKNVNVYYDDKSV